jgi:NitT/TauT family transport system permease protein
MTTAVGVESPESPPESVTAVKPDNGRLPRIVLRIAAVVIAIVVWQVASLVVDNPSVFPSFPKTIDALWTLAQQSGFWSAVGETVRITAQGEILAIVIGVPIGILIGVSRTADAFLSGYVNVFNAMPRIALIPLIVIWFGVDSTAKVVVVLTTAIFPIIINTEIGIKSVDPDHAELAKSYCASRLQELVHISIPTAIPSMLGGLRLAIGHGVVGAITAELLLSSGGIGGLITLNNNLLATSNVYALVIVLAVVGVAFVWLGSVPYRLAGRGRWGQER